MAKYSSKPAAHVVENQSPPPLQPQPQPQSLPPLRFAPSFDTRQPGDIILQASDAAAVACYFRLSLLANISTFFAELPPPGPSDLYDGIAILRLHSTSSMGLLLFLSLVRSTTTLEAYAFDDPHAPPAIGIQSILDAAGLARNYAAPLVFRLLVSGLDGLRETEPALEFAIWTIGGSEKHTKEAAERTIKIKYDLTKVDPDIVKAVKAYAPASWMQMQDLHLRGANAMRRWWDWAPEEAPTEVGDTACPTCAPEERDRISKGLVELFAECDSVEAVMAVYGGDLGSDCKSCETARTRAYYPRVQWLCDFATKYDLKGDELGNYVADSWVIWDNGMNDS